MHAALSAKWLANCSKEQLMPLFSCTPRSCLVNVCMQVFEMKVSHHEKR